MKVGASVFGGKQDGGEWRKDWADNGGTDEGDHGNHLTGTTSFAELGNWSDEAQVGSIGNALGGIPDGSKIEITYNGKRIVAEKNDVGTGGPSVGGQKRAVDLWWETANLLGFQDGTGVITIHGVPLDTPTTPLTGKPAAADPSDTTTQTASPSGACCATADTTSGTLMGDTNAQRIWNYLTGKDGNLNANDALTPEQAAGVMGNLKQESGFRPTAEEGNGIGYGIAQWSFGRRDSLEAAAERQNVKVSDLMFQLKYLVQESKSRVALSKYGGGKEWAGLKKQTTIEKALVFWHDNFERSADSPEAVIKNRGGFANDVYKSFAGKSSTTAGAGASTATGGSKPVIFIDPGHGGAIPDYTDQKSGLKTNETHNMPETKDVLEIAKRIKSSLEPEGYEVVLARTGNDDQVKFRDRSDKAAAVHAALGVSIHTSPGKINEVWPQRVGTFRTYNGNTDTFKNTGTAKASETDANIFKAARTAAEGHTVTTDPNNTQQTASFGRGGNIASTGNIPLVSLWSPTVPWVYNEIGQDSGGGLSKKLKDDYTKGLIDGIKKAVLPAGQNGQCSDSFAGGGDFDQTLLAYAWPTHHNAVYTKKQPAYEKAVVKAHADGRYVGGNPDPEHLGVDCGGFVTTLMVDSGYEPKYNYSSKLKSGAGPTGNQANWLKANWESLGPASDMDSNKLKKGDVAMSPDHTYVYVGPKGTIKGFSSSIASASYSNTGLSWRSPMAGTESTTASGFTWYRKK
jgi:N-acetylmuramoyl-L-alanine amidase